MMRVDNNTIWNEAAKAGAWLGAVSIGCLLLKEGAAFSGSSFLIQAATIILWAVEFFGCILLMKKLMLDLRDRYEGVKIEHTYTLGKRAALLSGLLLASAQALIIMRMPPEAVDELISQFTGSLTAAQKESVENMMDSLPLITFIFQWLYCYIYGTVLSSILSRYIFLQKLFGSNVTIRTFGPEDSPEDSPEDKDEHDNDPDEQ